MKQDIINLLRTNPDLTTNDIVNGSTHKKRGSVSKCLTRMVRNGDIHYRRRGNRVEYFLPPVTTPSPANSEAPATANA